MKTSNCSLVVFVCCFISCVLVSGCCSIDPIVETGSVESGTYPLLVAATRAGAEEFAGVGDMVVVVRAGGDEIELSYTDSSGQSVVSIYSVGDLVRDGDFCLQEDYCASGCADFPSLRNCSYCSEDSDCNNGTICVFLENGNRCREPCEQTCPDSLEKGLIWDLPGIEGAYLCTDVQAAGAEVSQVKVCLAEGDKPGALP